MRVALLACAAVFILALGPVAGASSATQGGATPAKAQAASSSGKPVDYEFFKTRVQPILLHKRKGNARCVSCHVGRTAFVLASLSPGATTWNEEQSRVNYRSASQFVVPGDPTASRLLVHPLATEAGGSPAHTGGKFWISQNDPEFLTLSEWIVRRR